MAKLLLVWALLLTGSAAWAMPPCSVGHIRPDTDADSRDAYFLELLELALHQTELDFGPCTLDMAPVRMSQSRAIASLREGSYVDVVWTMTSEARETSLLPVRVPLLQGLMGVRIPVVRADDVPHSLSDATTPDELKAYTVAQGHDWPDTRILAANGLQVATSSSYESLFRMLAHRRVDYVPRSVTEVATEQHLYDAHNLRPLDGPLIAYYAPSYFFVQEDDLRLALRLEVGLRRAIEDGSFFELFQHHSANRKALDRLEQAGDRIIWLQNPELPKDTPVARNLLWYAPVFGHVPEAARPWHVYDLN